MLVAARTVFQPCHPRSRAQSIHTLPQRQVLADADHVEGHGIAEIKHKFRQWSRHRRWPSRYHVCRPSTLPGGKLRIVAAGVIGRGFSAAGQVGGKRGVEDAPPLAQSSARHSRGSARAGRRKVQDQVAAPAHRLVSRSSATAAPILTAAVLLGMIEPARADRNIDFGRQPIRAVPLADAQDAGFR